ncbi:DUF6734 family protein [Bacteroides sp.]|uniref:DUF6734 family protein n=1 Tax=Bacteroides sp. TaxID=29523 RepID=UPI002628D1ED|nr:DUF6734 family protein [Bacteroides sp.]MDD3038886.1 hypothetical protein [Bacteroides sp.]
MKVVQTFWTCNKSLLENSFGWVNPQYHLMSWALSCLSLKEHYENVVLYTDSNGCKVFAELLGLPYKDVIIKYDNLLCPEPHWAYPKVITYSLQKEPFIHVDGDVYLPERLSCEVEKSGLIAQNLEIGSSYYKNMMNDVLQRGISLPSNLKEELDKDSIGSYNAGVLGGNDLDFIKEYCQIAFHIIESNHLNDMDSHRININNNILFEQILFYAITKMHNKSVRTILDHSVRDNGYCYKEFCDFYSYNNTKLMHILGGHKRNLRICELLGKTLLNKYPDYYKRIIELFRHNHKRMQNETKHAVLPDLSIQLCIASYQDFLLSLSEEWEKLSNNYLYNLEERLSAYPIFLNAGKEEQYSFIIRRNPHLSIYEIPEHWPVEAKGILKERINKDINLEHYDVACIPCLLYEGVKEFIINDLCRNILILLEEKKSFKSLFDELLPCFSSTINKDKEEIYKLILIELESLFYNGLIYIN